MRPIVSGAAYATATEHPAYFLHPLPELAMRSILTLAFALAVSACATVPPEEMLANAEPLTRTEANGDVITEYRVAGALKMVKVVPSRGPTYYIHDRDGDGKLDWSKGEAPLIYYKLYSW
jgi:Protein of unknown function (DUF2782)